MERFRKILRHPAALGLVQAAGILLALTAGIAIGLALAAAPHQPIAPREIPPDTSPTTLCGSTQLTSLSHSTSTIGGRGSGMVNLLLIGQDRREGETRARSDSIVLCSFHTQSGKLTMTSFLRDLYVRIPGYRSNRLNAAYALGGMDLLEDTLRENFDIHIDGCIEMDFSQFPQLVDLRGGVAIQLRQDEAELLNNIVEGASLSAGMQTLNGQEALAYARIRNLDGDGDFSRTRRQRKLISAFFDQCRGSSLTEMMDLVEAALPMVTTNLKRARLLTLAAQLLPMVSDMEIISQQIPADGNYTNETIDGMAVLVADMEATRQYLAQTLSE